MSRPAAIAAVLFVALLTALSLVPRQETKSFRTPRCMSESLREPREPIGQMPSWRPPVVGLVRLWERDGRVEGDAPTAATPILSLDREAMGAWQRYVFSGGEVGYLSPPLEADLSEAKTLKLAVVPGAARYVRLTASFEAEIDRRQRGLRTLAFPIESGAGDQPLVLEGAVGEVVGGNWDDEAHPHRRLRRIEIRIDSETEAEGFDLLGLQLLGDDASYTGSAASQTLEVGGMLRPGWYLRGGSRVILDETVPAGILTGAVAGTGEVTLTVDVGGERVVLDTTDAWTPFRLPVDGGKVTLVAEGDGVALLGSPVVEPTNADPAPNVIVVMVDTLRADHLDAWGAKLKATPYLDQFADEGASFGLAQSTASWTKPAIPTLMTGIWATTHQVGAQSYTDRLPESVPTLQTALGAAGWRTGSFSASPLGSTLSGLEHGFDTVAPPRHWQGRTGPLGHTSTPQLTEALMAWWDESDAPVFAYLHAMEVHAWRRGVYKRGPGNRHSYVRALMDFDSAMGELRAALADRGELDNTLVVITSDHGEAFGDHGTHDHGTSLYQSQIHIPLIFWADALPASWSDDPVGLADLAPTILDLLGVDGLSEADGRSLVPAIASGEAVHDFVPSAREHFVWRNHDAPIYALTTSARMKLVQQNDEGYSHFFDLDEGLCEAETSTWTPWFAQRQLDQWLQGQVEARKTFAEHHPSGAASVRADDIRMLEEMGYLE